MWSWTCGFRVPILVQDGVTLGAAWIDRCLHVDRVFHSTIMLTTEAERAQLGLPGPH